MSIKDISEKIKLFGGAKANPLISNIKSSLNMREDFFIVFSIILIGLAGFGLGKLSALEKGREPVQIGPANFTSLISTSSKSASSIVPVSSGVQNMSASVMIASESAKGLLVASKNGTKYHFPWCAGASQIADKNKIWFNSYEEAQKAGYTPASNCKGLN